MNRRFTSGREPRIGKTPRHYHRSQERSPDSWDHWVSGNPNEPKNRPWGKILAVTVGLVFLLVIVIALIIELAPA